MSSLWEVDGIFRDEGGYCGFCSGLVEERVFPPVFGPLSSGLSPGLSRSGKEAEGEPRRERRGSP